MRMQDCDGSIGSIGSNVNIAKIAPVGNNMGSPGLSMRGGAGAAGVGTA